MDAVRMDSPSFPRSISIEAFRALRATFPAPQVLDVRRTPAFERDPVVIPGSVRCAPEEVPGLAGTLEPWRQVVAVCVHGHDVSQDAVSRLASAGFDARSLDGGIERWRAEGGGVVPWRAPTRWVTRERPKIDRIACPWLIRRFIDPAARFLFVAPAEVADVAERFAATPFDIEGVRFSHRGELCSFDAVIADFGLASPALERLALIVRGADTDRHDLAPQAAGLLALSVGLSRMYRDDLEQLQAGIALYDALYRWARDGFEEGHDWPAGRVA